MPDSSIRVLYLSYDGAMEPLGQSQVLPYLRGLASRGAAIHLLSFEKPADLRDRTRLEAFRADLASQGIGWTPLRYHKHPTLLATGCDVVVGVVRAARIVKARGIRFVHARSYVAGLMGWLLKRTLGVRFVFDMRGFWADERVEGQLWPPGSAVYRLAKRVERRLLADADEIVTLTARARQTVQQWPGLGVARVTVIPTCVDLQRFPAASGSRAPGAAPVFLYSGSLGTWYGLPEMLRFLGVARKRFPGSRLMLLSRNVEEVRRELPQAGLPEDSVAVASVPHDRVAAHLAGAHAGLAFYRPGWARQATCPTKIGEYLATGMPVVVNDAVGDVRELIGANRVGSVLTAFSREAYEQALDELERLWADPGCPARCRRVAESYFSLEGGVQQYWDLYGRVSS